MALNDSDQFLVNDGTKTETITFAQFQDGTVLNDFDQFLVNDGTKTETVTWAEIQDELGPSGTVNQPTVVKPKDGAGSGEEVYLKSDTITKVEGGGIHTCETDTIQSVSGTAPNITLTFPSSNGFDCFPAGTVVQGYDTITRQGQYIPLRPECTIKTGSTDDMFDGNTSTEMESNNANGAAEDDPMGKWEWDEPILVKSSLELYMIGTENARKIFLTDDKGSNSASVGSLNGKWNVIPFTGNLKSFTIVRGSDLNVSGSFRCSAIKIDGVLLDSNSAVKVISQDEAANTITVDGGEWITGAATPKYSDRINGNLYSASYAKEYMFNGDSNNFYLQAASIAECTFSPPLQVNNKVTLTLRYQEGKQNTGLNNEPSYIELKYAGNNYRKILTLEADGSNTSVVDATFDDVASGQLEAIRWYSDSSASNVSSNYIAIGGVSIDGGALLVDGPNSGDSLLVKETPYDTKLTVAGSTDLADMSGSVFSTDGTGAPGPYSQTPYKLTTTDIESVGTANYSDNVTNTAAMSSAAGRAAVNSFDGDENTWAQTDGQDATNDYFLTYSFPGGLKINQQLRVWAYSNTSEQFANLTFADTSTDRVNIPHTAGEGSAERKWVTLVTGSKTLSKIDVERKKTGSPNSNDVIGYAIIEVDGNVLLDDQVKLTFPGAVSTNPDLQYFREGDEIGPNRIWSSTKYCVSGAQGNGVYNSTRAFNGETTGEQIWYAPNGGPVAKFDTGELFLDAEKIEINYASAGNSFLKVNGIDVTPADGENTLELPLVQGFRYLEFNYPSSGNYFGICWIKIDDVLLEDKEPAKVISTGYPDSNTMTVDGGTWNTGDTVEYETKGGNGTIVEVNTDDNTLKIANSSDRDERWIGPNKAATDFAVAGPSVIDEPLLTTNVELESSQFATTPNGVDGLKEIIWRLNGVTQSAGTLNPYRPSGLALNTTYTVEVQHVGNALKEPSEWSTSTTFTTGASRSLKEHYLSKILTLEEALEAAEAKPKRGRKKAN